MPQENHKEIRLEDYFWTIWRSKFSIFIIFIVAVLTAFVKNDVSPPVYEAKARIWIKDEQSQIPFFEDLFAGSGMMGRATRVETLKEIIRSRNIVTQTVEELELDKNPLPKHRGKIISGLANLFKVELKDQVYDAYTEDILFSQNELAKLKEEHTEAPNIEKCLTEIKKSDNEIAKVKDKLGVVLDNINGDLELRVLLQIKHTSRNLASQTRKLLAYQNQIGRKLYQSEPPDFGIYSEKIKESENVISRLTSALENQVKRIETEKTKLRQQKVILEKNGKVSNMGVTDRTDPIEKRIGILDSVVRDARQILDSAKTLLDSRRQFVQFKKQKSDLALQVLEAFTVVKESQRLRKKKCIEKLRDNLEVKPLRETNIIEINVKAGNANRAQEVVNTVAKNFKNYMREDVRAQMQATTDFAGDKANEVRNKLEEAENELAEFQNENNMVDATTESVVVKLKAIEELRARFTTIKGQRKGAEVELENLLEKLNGMDEKVISSKTFNDNPTLIELRQSWIKDKVQLAGLKKKYPTGEHAEINRLEARMKEEQKEIAKLEKSIISRTETLNPIRQQLSSNVIQTQAKIDALNAQETVLQNEISEYNQILQSMPQKQVELAKRKREVELYKTLLASLQQTNQQASIFKEAEVGNVKELDRAYEPEEPISPRTKVNMLLGALIGISLGIGLAFLRDAIDNRYHTIEEAQRDFDSFSPAPIYLGLVPPIADDSQRTVPLMSNMSSNRRGDNVLEAFRLIRTKLQFLKTESDIKTMVVTSSVPGEGKTTIVVNSAMTLGRMENKVLLVDADLRRPKLHKTFDKISRFSVDDEKDSEDDQLLAEYKSDSKKKPGLSELLLEIGHGGNIEELVKRVTRTIEGQENIRLIPSGTKPPEPSQMLSSDSMRKLMDYLKEQYDYIVIDAPPAGFADPMVLAEKVDCVLYVLDLSKSKKPEIQNGLENLIEITSDSSTPIGVICNWAEMPGMAYYYGYYGGYYGYYRYKYGYYGSYYYDYNEERKQKKGVGRLKRFLLGNNKKRIGKDDEEPEK